MRLQSERFGACEPHVPVERLHRSAPPTLGRIPHPSLPSFLSLLCFHPPLFYHIFTTIFVGISQEEGWGPLGRPASCSPAASPLPPRGDASVPSPLLSSPAPTTGTICPKIPTVESRKGSPLLYANPPTKPVYS